MSPAKPHRWRRRLGCAAAVLLVLLTTLYLLRVPLLTAAAELWVVNDPVDHADAILVLGGGLENRPASAARLYHAGIAPKILYMNVALAPVQTLGILPTEAEQTRRLLRSNNVPADAMCAIGTCVASTFDESRAVRAWLEKTGSKSIVITTDPFHTRRARWIFNRELRGTGAEIHLVPAEPRRYRITNWWQHEEGVVAFQNEVVKLVYYHLKY